MPRTEMTHDDWADLNVKDFAIAASDLADDLRNPLRRGRVLEQWARVTNGMDELLAEWDAAQRIEGRFREAAE